MNRRNLGNEQGNWIWKFMDKPPYFYGIKSIVELHNLNHHPSGIIGIIGRTFTKTSWNGPEYASL
jgi:hypothetical protein